MINQTNIKIPKKYQSIISEILDFNYMRWNNSGEYYRRYKVIFNDESYYTTNSKADILHYLRYLTDDEINEKEKVVI